MNTIQICFTVPNNLTLEDTIAWKCFKRLPVDFPYMCARGASIVSNRNSCIIGKGKELKYQINLPYDNYLFIDSDIAFTINDIYRILSCKKDVVSGLYQSRTNNLEGVAGWVDESFNFKKDTIAYQSVGIHQVDWVGAGFLLINRNILYKLPYPWFRTIVLEFDDCAHVLSEDLSFCKSLKDNSIPLYINCDIKVIHIV